MTQGKPPAGPPRATMEMDAEGGITIPLSVLHELGMKTGDRVRLLLNGERIRIEPVQGKARGDEQEGNP